MTSEILLNSRYHDRQPTPRVKQLNINVCVCVSVVISHCATSLRRTIFLIYHAIISIAPLFPPFFLGHMATILKRLKAYGETKRDEKRERKTYTSTQLRNLTSIASM